MNQIKEKKGITLIALVVTIIVLLILAGVTISLVLGQDGIFSKAEVAAEKTNEGQELDQVRLAVLEARTNSIVDKTDLEDELRTSINKVYPGATVEKTGEGEDVSYTITLPNGNQYIVDSNGNVTKGGTTTPPETGNLEEVDGVKVPKDFTHIAGDTREEGIVVADASNNFEYVWIPVTKDEEGNPTEPYVATNGELNGKVIQLQRNNFGKSYDLTNTCKEETPEEHTTSGKQNAIAESITAFKESVVQNGGYFLGRYEAGIEGGTLADNPSGTAPDKNYTYWTGGTLVCKAGQQVWNNITQNKASELCKNIDNNYIGVTSDLVNSYAWDTAIVFIQACGTNSDYANQVGKSTTSSAPSKTGEAILASGTGAGAVDKQCNIYDMAGNCYEWSTETYNSPNAPCVYRGGSYFNSSHTPSIRGTLSTTLASSLYSIRPLLYWNS